MAKNEEREIVTGLETVDTGHVKEAEYDLVTALMEAASYREDKDLETVVDIRRGGKFYFSVTIRPIGDAEARAARKKATKMMANPNNRKLPPIEKEFNASLFNSLIIYAATTDEDKKKIWGNREIMDKYGLVEPHESIDILLTVGEKTALSDKVVEISGMDIENDDVSVEDYTKN